MDELTWWSCQIVSIVFAKELTVPESVLEAIKQGQWDYEPETVKGEDFECTPALPGTSEKVSKLAQRALDGLPLWHPDDRLSFDESDEALT